MYGLFGNLQEISPGGYMEELFLERESARSYPKTGRFMLARYDALLVSPATSNTVAKIVHGIADGLVTNAVSLANKSDVPVYILPTDVGSKARSHTPYTINREICSRCEICPPRESCPRGAIKEQIDLSLCDGCGTCEALCEHKAIHPMELHVRTREIDRENIEKLKRIPGIVVLSSPDDIYDFQI